MRLGKTNSRYIECIKNALEIVTRRNRTVDYIVFDGIKVLRCFEKRKKNHRVLVGFLVCKATHHPIIQPAHTFCSKSEKILVTLHDDDDDEGSSSGERRSYDKSEIR